MRHFKKIDWSISLSLLFGCVLTVVGACVESSGPLGAPNVIRVPTVSAVQITLAQSTLAPGQTTQVTAIATSSDGKVVGGAVAYSSQNVSIATVSSKGVVTAVAAGIAVIQATVGGRAATASVTVKPFARTVAIVAVALDSTSLAIGHSAKAIATAKDSAGSLIADEPVTWASLSPTVATVSSEGMVTAVAPGSAIVQASVSGITGLGTLVVVDSLVLAFHDFNDGTMGPYNDWASSAVVYPTDPTGSGRGMVNRILYAAGDGLSSNDVNMEFDTVHHYRYGETIWFKGDLYIPSTLSDGITTKTTSQNNDTRKLVDYFQGQTCRVILERGSGKSLIWVAGDRMGSGVYHEDVHLGNTGIVLNDDTWYTIEMRVTMNSADNVRDGVLEIYVNNSTSTPNFVVSSGLGWITEAGGATFFNSFRFGTQLTTYAGEAGYSEYRYWDNVGFSTSRIGR